MGGNDWVIYFDLLLASSPMAAAIFTLAIAFTQIALFNILTGMFVENALKVAGPDRDALAVEQRRQEIKEAMQLRQFLVSRLGCHGSNATIGKTELYQLAEDPHAYSVFATHGIELRDAEMFFDLMQTLGDSQSVDLDYFLAACFRLRGPASSLDLQTLLATTQLVGRQVEELTNKIDRKH